MDNQEKMQKLRDKISGYQLIIDNVMEKVINISSSGSSNIGMIKAIVEHVRNIQEMVDDMQEKHDSMLEEHLKSLTGVNQENSYDIDIYDILDSINSPEHRELLRLMMMSEAEMIEECEGQNLELLMDYIDNMSVKDMLTTMEMVDRQYQKTKDYIDEESMKMNRLNKFMQRRDLIKNNLMRKKCNMDLPLMYNYDYDYSAMYKKGQRVSWSYGEGRGSGTIISIHTKPVTKTIDGSEITRNGTEENPAVYINSDNGNNVLKLASELRLLKKFNAQGLERSNVQVGQRVSWAGGVNRGIGTVVSVHKNSIKKTINGIRVMVQGTEENPAVIIKADSGQEVIKRESDLQLHQKSNPKNNKNLKTSAAKYDHINFKPTVSMAEEARQGLEMRDKYNRGGTSVGMARARTIANRQNLSPSTVNRMVSFFARHAHNRRVNQDNGEPSNWWIAHKLWGGDSGKSWANARKEQMNAADKK